MRGVEHAHIQPDLTEDRADGVWAAARDGTQPRDRRGVAGARRLGLGLISSSAPVGRVEGGGAGSALIAASSSVVTSSMRAVSWSSWPSSSRASRAWWSVNRPCRARSRSARRARARPRASSASTFGLRRPAVSASIIARPDTPSTSVSTEEILIRASSSSFSIRCLTRVRSSTRS